MRTESERAGVKGIANPLAGCVLTFMIDAPADENPRL